MDESEMIEKIADVLDADAGSLTMETSLDSLAWDSMAMLSVIALARTFGKKISANEVREMKTIGDIVRAL